MFDELRTSGEFVAEGRSSQGERLEAFEAFAEALEGGLYAGRLVCEWLSRG